MSEGLPACPAELASTLAAVPGLPVLVGSGVTAENIEHFSAATALIIGTEFKQVETMNHDCVSACCEVCCAGRALGERPGPRSDPGCGGAGQATAGGAEWLA